MKYLTLLLLIVLTGCMSTSGTTEYTLKPIENSKGEMICCEATVYNSKDYEKLKFVFKKNAKGEMEVTLDEKGVNASTPQMIQSENNSKLLEAVTRLIPLSGN